ncbi:ATP-binding protein [Streptomyces sp. NPDC059477]|uniref:sensor histidine kinase n=1 Tax=Streptomyces sp. NPDC059477 TaxID=3346847 RepID=UPI0036CC42A6
MGGGPPTPRGLRNLAVRWPFRQKLNVLVGVPLAGLALLLSYLIAGQVGQARDAAEAAQLVRDSVQVAELVDRVQTEHQQAILLSVRFEAIGTGQSSADYRLAQGSVDEQVDKVRDTFGDRLPESAAGALREIDGLTALRATIEQGYLPADNIDPAYTSAADALIDGLGLDRNSALAATFTGNLLDSLLRADTAHAAFETGVFSAATRDSNAQIQFIGAVGAHDLYTHQAERFARFATEEQAAELAGIEHGSALAAIELEYAEQQIDPSGLQAESPEEIRDSFTDALATFPTYRAQAEARLEITASLIGQIADRADAASTDAWWNAGWLLGAALLGYGLWFGLSVVVRRSVVRPVLALTGAAREVAEAAGRELARVADDDTEDEGPPLLRDMPVTADDEIGELADAFNRVQTTAVALLARQVLSRRNVAEMFGNVGRRVSNLTTRQLALIDAVERGETDPELLERLYRIDHIAVRLRRNADSLMLLAGLRETVLASGPAALTNVVRAALGQIEGYQRVELHAGTEVMVEPDIIGDLTLMVAELLENAVAFPPAGSPVEVTVRTGAGGEATITVADHGLGMSPERLAEENARLVRRERLDLVPTKVLGLFVVGTLARRWEIGVDLARTQGGGVTAGIHIPASLLLTMSAVGAPASADRALSANGTTVPTANGTGGQSPAPDSTAGQAPPGDSGPLPAATLPAPPDAVPLPRRVPRRDPAAEDEGTSLIPRARTEPPLGAAEATARPLRRRVRGATLRTTLGTEAERQPASAAQPADADAVRDALEEFEAAIERAHRDSGGGSTGPAGSAGPEAGTRPAQPPATPPAAPPGTPPGPDPGHHQPNQPHRPPPHPTDPTDPTDQPNPNPNLNPNHQNHLPEGAEQ